MPLWAIAVVVAAPVVVGLAALVWRAVSLARWTTVVERVPVEGDPSRLGLRCEHVSFRAGDGLTLRGWYLPAGVDDRCIVMVQGEEHHRNSPGIRALELANDLVGRGFSVLLFDLRGRGESEGERGSAGIHELRDVRAALSFVQERGIPPERTGLLGFSLGAGLAILAAAEEPRIGALACDSAFKDLLDDYRRMRLWGVPLPGWLLIPMVRLSGWLLFHSDPGRVRPIKVIRRMRTPALLVHGEADSVVPASDSVALYDSHPGPIKVLWLLPGVEHVQGYAAKRGEYIDCVARFFEERLGGSAEGGVAPLPGLEPGRTV